MGDRLFPFEVELPLDGVTGEVVVQCETDDPSGGAEGNGPAIDTKTITVQLGRQPDRAAGASHCVTIHDQTPSREDCRCLTDLSLVGADADVAVEQLYAAHWRQLVRLSVLLVHDQAAAEDVVQDAFVAMHGKWSRLRDPDKALAYLRQAVVNRSRSALRHRVVVERHARTTRSGRGHRRRAVGRRRPPRRRTSRRCSGSPSGSARCSSCGTTWTGRRRRSPTRSASRAARSRHTHTAAARPCATCSATGGRTRHERPKIRDLLARGR